MIDGLKKLIDFPRKLQLKHPLISFVTILVVSFTGVTLINLFVHEFKITFFEAILEPWAFCTATLFNLFTTLISFASSTDQRIKINIDKIMSPHIKVMSDQIKEMSTQDDRIKSNISNTLGHILSENKSIMVAIPIHTFSSIHVRSTQRILSSLNDTTKLIALDATSAPTWWSNSMLGYLALQSDWRAHNPERQIVRIFIKRKEQLENEMFKKLIKMHLLCGFETYILSYDWYKKLNQDSGIDEKEFLIWDNDSEMISFTNSEADKYYLKFCKTYINYMGYESYWGIDTDEGQRDSQIDKLSKSKNCKRESVLSFCFIQKDKRDKYLKFIKKISVPCDGTFVDSCPSKRKCADTDHCVVCKSDFDSDCFEGKNHFSIKICTQDIDVISNILTKYREAQ